MTIHDTHPFADPDPDPARRLRGRLGGAVTLWTSGDEAGQAGLTLTSVMAAMGPTPALLGLIDPDSDLADVIERTGRVCVSLLSWRHRDLADAFAGVAPAPGGPFRQTTFTDTAFGPRPHDVTTWAGGEVDDVTPVGWSLLVRVAVRDIVVGEDAQPLLHRRGRYLQVDDR